MTRPTRAIVNLTAIVHNFGELRALTPPGTGLIAVVKADAYGHGLVPVARRLAESGASLAVATVEEARTVRDAGIVAPLLILGPVPAGQVSDAAATGAALTLHHRSLLAAASSAASRLRSAVPLHLLVDTGMGRLGFRPEEVPEIVAEADRTPGITLEGIFSHFAKADTPDDPLTMGQIGAFAQVLSGFRGRRWIRHLANSAGVVHFPEAVYDAVRPGLALYGIPPSPGAAGSLDLRPAMTLATAVAQVRDFPAGTGIGYGHTWRSTRATRIAVLPIGYADGLPWHLSNRGSALISGTRCPFAGRVCMDLVMVDVTGVQGVAVGSPAILVGSQGGETVSAIDLAADAGTIPYEIICRIGPRVPRTYIG